MHTAPARETLPGLDVLEQTPIILEKLVHLVSEEDLVWKPEPDRWSISEVVAHLADVEVAGFRDRVQQMVERDDAFLAEYDQEAQYAAGKYSAGKANEHLKKFCHERDRSLSFLRYLPATAAFRTGHHELFGTITVGQLMNEWAFHDLGHVRQIAELFRARAFYPHMGPFQNYYKVRP